MRPLNHYAPANLGARTPFSARIDGAHSLRAFIARMPEAVHLVLAGRLGTSRTQPHTHARARAHKHTHTHTHTHTHAHTHTHTHRSGGCPWLTSCASASSPPAGPDPRQV
jgi:hypothetical protein